MRGCLLALALTSVACTREQADVASMSSAALPFVDRYERVERWLSRGLDAEPGFRSRASLEEALRAPLRREEELVAAWVDRDGEEVFAYGDAERPTVQWTRVHDDESGDLWVARATIAKRPANRRAAPEVARCVLVSRPTGDRDVAVTAAYVETAARPEGGLTNTAARPEGGLTNNRVATR